MASYGQARLTGNPRDNLIEDMTQTSALILAFGLLAFIPAVVDLIGSSAENVDWNGADGIFPPIVLLLGNLTRTLFGMSSVFIGFQYLSSKWGSKFLSLFGLGITLAAWYPFLATISLILFQADNENIAGPPLLIPFAATNSEIWSIAIMGILGFMGYASVGIGALTFFHWKMYRYFAGYAATYSASYYRSRQAYYGFLTLMVGAVQLALGAYVKENYDDGQLPVPLVTGPFFILWPEISITVGVVQALLGVYIVYRSASPGVDSLSGNSKDGGLFMFQCAAWFVFLISVGCQVIGQVALNESPSPGLFVVNVVGLCIFPIYLDAMSHTTPDVITSDMFSMTKPFASGA